MGQIEIIPKHKEMPSHKGGASWKDMPDCFRPEKLPYKVEHYDGSYTIYMTLLKIQDGFFRIFKRTSYSADGEVVFEKIMEAHELIGIQHSGEDGRTKVSPSHSQTVAQRRLEKLMEQKSELEWAIEFAQKQIKEVKDKS